MVTGPDKRFMTRAEAQAADVDVGLRQYMLQVYNYMASGVALTGIVAYLVAATPALTNALFGNAIMPWIVMLAPIGLAIYFGARIHAMSFSAAQITFWVFAGLMGLSLSTIFLVYTGEIIARVFFITAGTFGAMSLYGYTTKRDSDEVRLVPVHGPDRHHHRLGGEHVRGSSALQFAISVIGVLVFVGLTAYDTQKIKEMYWEADDRRRLRGKKAVMGALNLYLDFINLFVMLLHLFGNRN